MEGTLSERFKIEREKIKAMTLKEKRDYIWEYYKIPIISVVCILGILGSIINSVFINPPKKSYAHLTIYGAYVDSTLMEKLGGDIADRIVEDRDNYTVYTSNFYDNPDDIEMNMALQQKFFAMIAAREIDVIIGTEEYIGGLAVEDMLLDLSDIITEFGGIPETDILATNTISSEQAAPYGVMLHDAEVMSLNGLNTDGYYMGLVINAARIPQAVEVMKELLR